MDRRKRSLVVLSVVGLAAGLPALPAHAISNSWAVDAPGSWGTPGNWTGGVNVADGTDSTATFGNIITADRVVTLDTARTIGNITASDTSHNYTISGANILTLDRSDATKPTIDVTTSGRTLTISSVIAGNDGLRKTGAGDLVLTGANTFNGGIDLAGGRILISDNPNETSNLGAASNVITFTASGTTFFNTNNVVTMPQGITINGGVTATMLGAFAERTEMSGVLAGSGTMVIQGLSAGWTFEARNTANTFTGPIRIISGDSALLRMNSLLDSPGPTTIGLQSNGGLGGAFEYASGAIAPLVLNNRQFELITNGAAATNLSRLPTIRNNASLANTMTINTDLLVTGTGLKRFSLEGSNTGNNTFAGVIPDAIGADVLHLYKQGGGKWVLAGDNTYEGDTNVDQGNLTLASAGSLLFKIGANGVNNRIRGDAAPGTLTLDGSFVFDLTAADLTVGNMWNVVDSSILGATTFNPSFGVNLFTDAGSGLWTLNSMGVQFQFNETTGVLSTLQLAFIPEPATATLGLLGLVGLLKRRRRAV